jgi:hypothetical protein
MSKKALFLNMVNKTLAISLRQLSCRHLLFTVIKYGAHHIKQNLIVFNLAITQQINLNALIYTHVSYTKYFHCNLTIIVNARNRYRILH